MILMLCLLRLDSLRAVVRQLLNFLGGTMSALALWFSTLMQKLFFSAQPPVFLMPLCQTAILLTLLLFTVSAQSGLT